MAGFAIPLITAGISGLAGLFGNRKKVNTSTSDTTDNSSTQGYQNTTHNFTGEQKTLIDKIMQSLAGQKSFDTSGYVAGGLQGINQGANALQRSLKNVVASRGLSFSPAGFNPQAQAENSRIAQQNQFLETVPQVQQQYDQVNYENLLKGFGLLPTDTSTNLGSSTNSVRNTKTTSTDPGNKTGGFLSGLGSGLLSPIDSEGNTSLDMILTQLGL